MLRGIRRGARARLAVGLVVVPAHIFLLEFFYYVVLNLIQRKSVEIGAQAPAGLSPFRIAPASPSGSAVHILTDGVLSPITGLVGPLPLDPWSLAPRTTGFIVEPFSSPT